MCVDVVYMQACQGSGCLHSELSAGRWFGIHTCAFVLFDMSIYVYIIYTCICIYSYTYMCVYVCIPSVHSSSQGLEVLSFGLKPMCV